MPIPAPHRCGGDEEKLREFSLSYWHLLGFGTVGSAVARRLIASEPLLRHPADAHLRPPRRRQARALPRRRRRLDVLASTTCSHSDADVVVEAIGGLEPAADWIRAALLAGKSVVTANKQVDRAPRRARC